MKSSLLIAVPCFWAFPVLAQAEQAPCTETHQMCALECRARIFASDPRQEICMQRCSATAALRSDGKLAEPGKPEPGWRR